MLRKNLEVKMRKKSHISLVRYLMNSTGMEDLKNYKKSLYVGSILPDCTPSFLTRRHCIEDTFYILKNEIKKITEDYDFEKGIGTYYCRHLGVVTHYLADYFTFPHNSIFKGTLKEHCVYEKELKFAFRNYVLSKEARRVRDEMETFSSIEEVFKFIESAHQEYLNVIKEVKIDCMYIVELCHKVVDAILQFLEIGIYKLRNESIVIA